MGGVGECETGSAESSAAVTGTAAAEASATGASRRYKMFSLLVRTQSSLRRRLRWRESDSRDATEYWSLGENGKPEESEEDAGRQKKNLLIAAELSYLEWSKC